MLFTDANYSVSLLTSKIYKSYIQSYNEELHLIY